MERLTRNATFTKNGRTYKVIGFNADKWGNRYVICDWLEERGVKSSHFFYASDF
jgi:hypothetical protein